MISDRTEKMCFFFRMIQPIQPTKIYSIWFDLYDLKAKKTGNSFVPSTGKDVSHNPSKCGKILKHRPTRLLQRPHALKGCDQNDQYAGPAKHEEVGKHNLWGWMAQCAMIESISSKLLFGCFRKWLRSIPPTFPIACCSKRLIDIHHIQCWSMVIVLMFQHSFSKMKHIWWQSELRIYPAEPEVNIGLLASDVQHLRSKIGAFCRILNNIPN